MISTLGPYPDLTDSGVQWLGDVPQHWEIRRLSETVTGCFNGIWGNEPDQKDDLPVVRVADFDRGRRRVRLGNPTLRAIAPGLRGVRLLTRGDLLIEKSGGGDQQPVGMVVLYDHDVTAVCSNFVARMPAKNGFDPRFLVYVHEYLYEIRLNARSIKQTTGIQNLDSTAYLRERFAFPSPPEQAAIVRFLDYAGGRIRQYIQAKTRLISLLSEQRNAIIHRAVTRGIDADAGVKDSGLDWLGEVPAHWELERAKRYYREADERSASGSEELLSVSHITGVTPRSEKNITMFKAESYVGHKLCRSGDLVINTMWAWMGALGVAKQTGIVSPAYAVYRLHAADAFHPQFIDYLLRTSTYVAEYVRRSTGIRSSRLRLYPPQFLTMPIVRPPLAEQQSIVDAVADRTRELDLAGNSARREITLLREYWGRLVSDVVTGKLDVRQAAADLPDLESVVPADELEPIDLEGLPEDELGDIEEELE